jgi:hypothetical protein
MSLASYPANPGELTLTLYPAAGTSAGAVNTPASFVVRLRAVPLVSFEITTLALGTSDPTGRGPPQKCRPARRPIEPVRTTRTPSQQLRYAIA